MKSLNEQAAKYSAKLRNQSNYYTKRDIETAYSVGSIENEELIHDETGSFGQAIESAKNGQIITRKEWKDKGLFIFMRPADKLPVSFMINGMKSLPERVKDFYYFNYQNYMEKDDTIKFTEYLCMKLEDNTIVNGWVPSQSDILANDWMIFEF